ncbi:hypothetical protein CP960_07330 [Malaciobacter halophilus]|uniref:Uncharacterized protein n=1 Tax=Malaciobacter halophilus TaxID=197482 RepID=A0A2N1J2L8_9BACT|nr:hypothetical protein [Malaciobacter halophilus]AXH09868.1 hypothetical protein AHALO_1499 [Malaciobacter halophilus]PKI80808.1 hypothetical protein CP960_07330 [Malaciobacter halophilus]
MPLSKLINKVKEMMGNNKEEIKTKKVLKILEELYIKKDKLKKAKKKAINKSDKKQLRKKLEAVKKLIKKSKKLI